MLTFLPYIFRFLCRLHKLKMISFLFLVPPLFSSYLLYLQNAHMSPIVFDCLLFCLTVCIFVYLSICLSASLNIYRFFFDSMFLLTLLIFFIFQPG